MPERLPARGVPPPLQGDGREGSTTLPPLQGEGRGGDGGYRAGAVLAFDFGIKRIGVALGMLLDAGRAGTARPLSTITGEANEPRFAAIARLIAQWQPVLLLVGRPLNDDGTPHEMTARCERFAHQLRGRYRLPVEQVDERFSSVAADADLRSRGLDWRQRKAQVDAEAACIILQSWFATHANNIAPA